MSVSLMLKTEEGKAAGYVLLLEDRLLWSFKGQGEEGILALLGGGAEQEIAVCCDGCERETRYNGPEPEAAYIAVKGALHAATCPRALRACAQRRQRKNDDDGAKEEKFTKPCKKDDDDRVYKGEAVQQGALSARAMPERRWPAPPCWPRARYCGGVWTEAGEDKGTD